MYKTTKAEYEIANNDIRINNADDSNKLGQGGFGTVFKGQWSGKAVAIKILTCELTGEVEADFHREIDLMLKLRGPQIIQTYGAVLRPTQAIVMELMPNGNLYNLLRKDKNLPWPLKYQIALDVAYGIKYLHDRSILHRDLKSLNVLLDEKYQAKICDFGLAKIKNASKSHTTTKQQGGVGTVLWMAPELFDFEVVFTKKSDIYALGMVLYELLSHQAPFEGNLQGRDPSVVVPPWLVQGKRPRMSDGPEAFKALIEQCWSQDIDMRPLAEKVIQSLEQIKLTDQMSKLNPNAVASGPQYLGLSASPPTLVQQLHQYSGASSSGSIGHPGSPLPPPIAPIRPYIISPRTTQELTKFLRHVGFGEQNEAEAMLQSKTTLAALPGDLTDCAGRHFEKITGFQYAIWALDYHMWTMIKKYLNIEHARAQVTELNTGSWVRTHGAQINLKPLIKALDVYVKNYDQWDYTKCNNHWCQQVGGAQLILPAHVINEYSHPSRPLYPCPKWNGQGEGALPRTGVNDWKTGGYGGELGRTFAWVLAEGHGARGAGGARGNRLGAGYDHAACVELLKSRTEQAQALVSELTLRPAAKPRP